MATTQSLPGVLIVRPESQVLRATEAELKRLLGGLGNSVSAVSKTLIAEGITGERLDDNKCPIANYLQKKAKLPKHSYLSVQHKAVMLLQYFAGEELFSLLLPRSVVKFIEAWDSGKYSKLADMKE